MRMVRSSIVSLLFISANVGSALAGIEGMPIHIGDTLEKVQDVYKTTTAPVPFKKNATARSCQSVATRSRQNIIGRRENGPPTEEPGRMVLLQQERHRRNDTA